MPLQLRICQYHNFKQLYHDEAALTALFRGLSDNLLTELKLYLFKGLILNCPLLQGVAPQIVSQLINSFEEMIYSPGDLVIRKGEEAQEMFLVVMGTCEVLGQGLKLLTTKSTGDYFGEIGALL